MTCEVCRDLARVDYRQVSHDEPLETSARKSSPPEALAGISNDGSLDLDVAAANDQTIPSNSCDDCPQQRVMATVSQLQRRHLRAAKGIRLAAPQPHVTTVNTPLVNTLRRRVVVADSDLDR